ncbi:response regulator transcription factor [Bradyrhizobium diazoefficiens]|jgi:two-component system response regulator FixJ|uniref:response regulator transcription factor n=1 Tax=unclassified Bradyrhizobium TaxID=2631580 RepID=UPI001888931B|nr:MULTISPECIES: response regulator [Bradyrhizobium]MBR0699613.1 response regulator transcription factor [Bradyrhizobium diazoefficiens]MBR0767948.1 response regulator transcription factor [Bradyrhizobium diazoefficiens]MBR0928480.1 response regulator transcription factor [Bradyrhizobium diazoefficiens]MDT4736260.1 response regulator [Bradyrhizobium sp. WYCCWR 12699]QOZ79355.1 DNA-binding response regulator [Bradyrhizobium sp. CCBAU 53351]
MPGNMLSKGEVFVIDTDAASREQLSTALQQSAYDVICFADGASLLSEAKARMPACVLMELPPDRSGLDMLRRLREENCMAPVLVTSANGSIAMAVDAIKSGATDFIEKPFRTHDLVDRIDAAIDEFAQPGTSRQGWLPGCEPLTAREVDVLGHLAAGLTNKEIARRMHLSARTVEGYRAGILKKAGAKNVTDLLRRIFGQGSPTQV